VPDEPLDDPGPAPIVTRRSQAGEPAPPDPPIVEQRDPPIPPEQAALPPHYPGDDDESLRVHAAERIRRLLVEKARRKIEALRLYEPMPEQLRFHLCTTRQRIVRGSNRSGKTLAAAVEFARCVTGQDPMGKFPRTDGRAYMVGIDLEHIGQVMWQKLARAGAFRIIRDLESNEWRCYRSWDPSDAARVAEVKPAPPLIPPRLIKKIAWENKARGIPKAISLHTGWTINCYSSDSRPRQGTDIDLAWFDEEIEGEYWYPEMQARLLDRRGKFFWSATPEAGTDQLFDLHERAEKERHERDKSIEEFVLRLAENPHVGAAEKRELAESLTDEQRFIKIEGEFLHQSFKMYPEFSLVTHVVPYQEIPPDWCRFMVVDPGHQVCAVLFAAVPPPGVGDRLFLYDELYIQYCDAEKFAGQVAQKVIGQSFEAFLIDGHAGRITPMAGGKNVEQQYSEALKKHKVRSRRTGSGFIWGSDDVDAGVLAVRSYLRVAEGGPRLRVLADKMPNFLYEIKRYHKKKERKVITDKPDQKKENHLMDCLRYLSAFRPVWRKPEKVKGPDRGAMKAFKEIKKRRRDLMQQGIQNTGVRFGPAGNVR
jgi:hypothetical protein